MYNFLVYVSKFFYRTLKKFFKFFIFLFIIITLFILFSNIVYGANQGEILTDGSTSQVIVPIQDMFRALDTAYNSAEVSFLTALEKLYNSGNTAVINKFMNYTSDGFYVYYDYYSTGVIRAYLYKGSNSFTKTTLQEGTYGIYAFSSLPGYVLTPGLHALCYFELSLVNNSVSDLVIMNNGSISIPSYLYVKRTELLMQFLNKYKYNNINNNYRSVLEEIKTNINNNTSAIQEQTDAINNQTNIITDSTVDSTASDLPSIDVTDTSQTGIDNIFSSMYNAFCVGQAQDIVFPIPFTNKNITLSPYYVKDMLENNGASWVYTFIQAFWGYIIGRFIIKDVSNKINKIKSGNIENIQNNNIKEDML